MIHSSHIRRGRSPPPSMYSSYVTRTGLHKILPFHRILFGRISYCSALYFDTATPGPSGRTLNTECRVYIYIYSPKQSGIRFYGEGGPRGTLVPRDTDNRVSFTGNAPSRLSLLSFRSLRHAASTNWPRSGPLRPRENDIYRSVKDVRFGINDQALALTIWNYEWKFVVNSASPVWF